MLNARRLFKYKNTMNNIRRREEEKVVYRKKNWNINRI